MGYDAERATLKAEFENYLGMKSAELEYTIVADAWGLHLQDAPSFHAGRQRAEDVSWR